MDPATREILGPRTNRSIVYKHIINARSTAYPISGSSGDNLRIPLSANDQLDITMPFLVIQIFHKANDPVNISLSMQNTTKAIFKFNFTTAERKNPSISSNTSANILLSNVPADCWTNLCFDLRHAVSNHWAGSEFESLQRIEIAPTCLIHWVFSSTTLIGDLPNRFRFTGGVESVTVTVGEGVTPRSSRKNRIESIPSQALKLKRNAIKTSGKKTKRKRGSESSTKPKKAPQVFEDDFDIADEIAAPPAKDVNAMSLKRRLPEGEEEELELVFIEHLGCYYCPNNQLYYEIDT
jgi:hypothetical protein